MGEKMVEHESTARIKKEILIFVNEYKYLDRSRIPENKIYNLSRAFRDIASISISFTSENPLSVMETVTIALSVIGASDHEVGDILSISHNTVKSYMARIKEKLNVEKKSEAIIKSLRVGILRIIY